VHTPRRASRLLVVVVAFASRASGGGLLRVHTVARSETGGGLGLPGTSKSTLKLQLPLSWPLMIVHVWFWPGAGVMERIVEPGWLSVTSTSFMSPSCWSW